MKKLGYIIILTTFTVFLAGSASWASTAYVTDSFQVTLRTGPSVDNKIIAMPSSGQRLEVVETQEDWSHVQLAKRDGETVEGWILTRYLVNRLPWELQTKSLQEENAKLKEKLSRINQERDELSNREQNLTNRLEATTTSLKKVQSQYESLKNGASDYLNLKSTFAETKSALESSKKSVEELSAENNELKSSQRNRWVLTGAAILLCGLMIGLVMGRQQKKRRSLYS